MKRSKALKLLLGILLCIMLIPINNILAMSELTPVVDLSATYNPTIGVALNRAEIIPGDSSLYDVRVTSVYDYMYGDITHDVLVESGHTYDITLQFSLKDEKSYISPLPHIIINGVDVPLDYIYLSSDSSNVEAMFTITINHMLMVANGYAYREGENDPITDAKAGEMVYLIAEDEANFDYWEVVKGDAELFSTTTAVSQFYMPDNDVMIQAHNRGYGPEPETVVEFKVDWNGYAGLAFKDVEILVDNPAQYSASLYEVRNHDTNTILDLNDKLEYGVNYEIVITFNLEPDCYASANPHVMINGQDITDIQMQGDFTSFKANKLFKMPYPLKEALVANGKAFVDDLNDPITSAYPGTTVYIVADNSDEFDYWEVSEGSVELVNPYSFTTSFTMPNENVKIQAHNRQYGPTTEPTAEKPTIQVLDIKEAKIRFVTPKTNENGNANEVKTADKTYKILNAKMEPNWDVPYKADTEYTLVVNLKANEAYKFTPSTSFTINDNSAEVRKLTDNEALIAYKFPKTSKVQTEVVPEVNEVTKEESNSLIYVLIGLIIIALIVIFVIFTKKRNHK